MVAVSCLVGRVYSQDYISDAVRYSQPLLGGTARSMGMGGAFGALGADFSSLSINPAGIGLYNRSEITFTPSLLSSNTSTSFADQLNKASRATFNFTNAGIVLAFKPRNSNSDWLSFNFGFGYNRQSDYNTRLTYSNPSTPNSLTDNYLNILTTSGPNGGPVSPSGIVGNTSIPTEVIDGFQSYLLDTLNGKYIVMCPWATFPK
jgi:hypothetical protein